jgi:septal ring factor EnvC (AmiA/AmiB activator)
MWGLQVPPDSNTSMVAKSDVHAKSDAANAVLFTTPYLYALLLVLLLLSGELRAAKQTLEATQAAVIDREQQLAETQAALLTSETALVARGAELHATKAKLVANEQQHASTKESLSQLQAQLPSVLASMQRQSEELTAALPQVLKLTTQVAEAERVKADLSSKQGCPAGRCSHCLGSRAGRTC